MTDINKEIAFYSFHHKLTNVSLKHKVSCNARAVYYYIIEAFMCTIPENEYIKVPFPPNSNFIPLNEQAIELALIELARCSLLEFIKLDTHICTYSIRVNTLGVKLLPDEGRANTTFSSEQLSITADIVECLTDGDIDIDYLHSSAFTFIHDDFFSSNGFAKREQDFREMLVKAFSDIKYILFLLTYLHKAFKEQNPFD